MDNLIKVGTSRFKISEAYRFSESLAEKIPLKNIISAAAKFGGPIAITADPSALTVLNSSTSYILDNILIFYNNGELVRQIPKNDLHKSFFQKSNPYIVGMDFLPDETLFVLSRQGIYNMIDPFTGNNKVFTLREVFFEENIVEAKLVGKTVVFYTNFKNQLFKFYFIRNIENPVVQEFSHASSKLSLFEEARPFFLVIPPNASFSGKIECFVSDYKLGAHRLIEDEIDKPEFVSYKPSSTLKKLPEIGQILCMALSPIEDEKPKKMAILNKANMVYVISIDTSNTTNLEFRITALDNMDEDEAHEEKKLHWCGDTSLVVTTGRYYILINPEGDMKKQVHRSKSFVVFPELDCLRMFSNDKCEVLRFVSDKYTKIFLPTSKAKAADLYNAYLEREENNPSPENNVIEDKKSLEEAVKDLLDAAYFEIDAEDQKVLLKAAAYGKAFLSKSNSTFQHDYFAEVCKNLRVVNALKGSRIGRVVTYFQFLYLDSNPRHFMDILMKYQLFYFANEIAQFLGYKKEIISQIYVAWACCRIEHNPNDEHLAEKIFERLRNDENASYIEVAHKAYESSSTSEKNRKDLALKIIHYEPSIQKKVTFLLWVEQYELALSEAAKSLDPNLIDLVILRLVREQDTGLNVWKILSDNARTRPRLIRYIFDFKYNRVKRNIDLKKKVGQTKIEGANADLDNYLERFATIDERVAFYILRCLTEQYEIVEEYMDSKEKKMKVTKRLEFLTPDDKLILVDHAQKLKTKNLFLGDVLAIFKTYIKEEKDKQERPVIEILRDKVMSGKDNEIAKKYKLSDRVAFIAKLRVLMEQPERFRQNEIIDKLIEDKNKKGDLVSFYEIVNMMIDYGMSDRAEKYAYRIKNWDEQLFMLKYLATTSSINGAIDQAIALKKLDDLTELAMFLGQVEANPGKYPNIVLNEAIMQKLERSLTGRK